ncbi:MAG: hypothetical protein V1742_13125 [Pseudomonadota bacterium]
MKTKCSAMVLIFILMLLCVPRAGAAQSNWSGTDLNAVLKQEVTGSSMAGKVTMTADPGSKILEVVGSFGSRNPKNASGPIDDIFVLASGKDKPGKSRVVAIGLVGKTGECSYLFPKDFKGYIKISYEATGDGYQIGRDKEDDPFRISLLKNPCRLCMIFLILEGPDELKLRFFDSDIPLPKPKLPQD